MSSRSTSQKKMLSDAREEFEKKAADLISANKESLEKNYIRPAKEKLETARHSMNKGRKRAVKYSKRHPFIVGSALFVAGMALGGAVAFGRRWSGSDDIA